MDTAAPALAALSDPRAATRRLMVDFLQMKDFSADPLILADGDGVWVWDVDGRGTNRGLNCRGLRLLHGSLPSTVDGRTLGRGHHC